ncbi:MAG: hypothetical protein K8S97_03800, partial [Anaerolineae bacterium]|nr:hypothetical protein [Anaerolineae bacterium]
MTAERALMAPRDHTPNPPAGNDSTDPGGHELYYDEPLDAVHDANGTVDPAHLARAASNSGAWTRLQHQTPSLLARVWWETRWIIYLAAFVLPILVLIVFLVLLNALGLGDNNADDNTAATSRPTLSTTAGTHSGPPTEIPTLPPHPEWPATVTFVSHSIPARIRNTLNAGQHGYAFWGDTGHAWLISAEAYDGSAFDPNIKLYD